MGTIDAMDDILGMTFGELMEIGEMTCTFDADGEPVALMAIVQGADACREVLDVIAKYEENEDDN